MKDFLKYMLAAIVGVCIVGVVFTIIGIMSVAGMVASSSGSETKVNDNSVFILNLSGSVEERSQPNPLSQLMGDDFGTYGLDDILSSIKKAKDNEKIKGICLNAGAFACSPASLEEIRNALVDFKESGKFIVAYGGNYLQNTYYLASVADKVAINPQGSLGWHGLATQTYFLKDLYDIYHDWNLVLAAYNCGPGTINKAIRRADGEKDFWALYNYLPKETRGYVPAFIAANYIMTYYCEHNISPMEMKMPEGTDTIHISRPLHLQQVASVCNISMDELRALNPEFKKDVIPGNEQPYALRLPSNMMSYFIDHEDSIYNYKPDTYLTRRNTVDIPEPKAVYHRIRNGETLGGIAQKYGVSVAQLRRLNGIRGSNIRAGKSIRIR